MKKSIALIPAGILGCLLALPVWGTGTGGTDTIKVGVTTIEKSDMCMSFNLFFKAKDADQYSPLDNRIVAKGASSAAFSGLNTQPYRYKICAKLAPCDKPVSASNDDARCSEYVGKNEIQFITDGAITALFFDYDKKYGDFDAVTPPK